MKANQYAYLSRNYRKEDVVAKYLQCMVSDGVLVLHEVNRSGMTIKTTVAVEADLPRAAVEKARAQSGLAFGQVRL